MNAAIKKLNHLIEERRSQIAEFNRQIREIEAEIQGYLLAIESLGEIEEITKQPSETSLPALSETWQRILSFIGTKEPRGASIDEIESFIISERLEVSRNSIRSQLSNYFQRGILKRISFSRYSLSDAGLLALSAANRNQKTNPRINLLYSG